MLRLIPSLIRSIRLLTIAAAALLIQADAGVAQKRCVNGISCGNSCIAATTTCRVGSAAPPSTAPAAPRVRPLPQSRSTGAPLVASSRARAQVPVAAAPDTCILERVVDGDTVVCADGTRVRLLLIDTPEMDQGPYGARAREYLVGLVPVGTPLRLSRDVVSHDRYGRTLAYLFTPDGRMVNEEIARAGYAVVSIYPPNVRHVDRITAAVKQAQDARAGLWETSAFECAPVDHRANRCE